MSALLETVAQTTDFNFEMDLSGKRWQWSSSVFDLLSVEPSRQPSTRLLLAAKHPDDRSPTQGVLQGAVVERKPFHYMSRLVRGDGMLRSVETTGKVALSSAGAPLAVLGHGSVLSDWTMPIFVQPKASSNEVSNGDLAIALLAHIEEAHAYAFRTYAPVVARASRCILRTHTQVDDVVQAVFEGLWLNPARYDSTRGSLGKYLQLQARGRSLDLMRSEYARSRRVLRSAATGSGSTESEDETLAAVSRLDLLRILDLLPAAERAVIALAYFDNMTYQMVAERLGLPEGTVKSRIRCGLAHLRALQPKDSSSATSNRA